MSEIHPLGIIFLIAFYIIMLPLCISIWLKESASRMKVRTKPKKPMSPTPQPSNSRTIGVISDSYMELKKDVALESK